jgi:hypothetical protein
MVSKPAIIAFSYIMEDLLEVLGMGWHWIDRQTLIRNPAGGC